VRFFRAPLQSSVSELQLTPNLVKRVKSSRTTIMSDYGTEWLKRLVLYLAVKANFTYMRGTDLCKQIRMITRAGLDRSNPNYDGINVYVDESGYKYRERCMMVYYGRITPAQYNVFRGILPNLYR
jgi:hypothetical protein